jgi:hypothetical protein
MSGAKHIVSINTDSNAPIMKSAHLKLNADLYSVLEATEAQLQSRQQQIVAPKSKVATVGEGNS